MKPKDFLSKHKAEIGKNPAKSDKPMLRKDLVQSLLWANQKHGPNYTRATRMKK